jgi:hypothetical protein
MVPVRVLFVDDEEELRLWSSGSASGIEASGATSGLEARQVEESVRRRGADVRMPGPAAWT